MKTIAFSQLENEKGKSHAYIKAVDMQGKDTGQDDFFAPCRVKVIAKTSSAHTVFFMSCDENGNEEPVLCADGKSRVVTIALTHIDDASWLSVGQIFEAGQRCYREGTYANSKKGAVANHVHIEVASGRVSFKEAYKKDGNTYLRFNESVSLRPTDVFFALEGYHTVREDRLISANKDRRVNLIWTNSREEGEEMTITMMAVKEVVVLRERISFDSKNKPNGKILAKMNKGESATVLEALPIQKDGFQWFKVRFKGMVGFMQYDSRCYELRF